MLGKIIGITDSIVSVHLDINIYDYDNLISKNVVFRDNNIISVGEVIGIDKDDNITNEEYHIIEAYRNLSDDLKLAINRILQIDM